MKRIITILFVFCMSLIYAEKSYSQNKTRIDVTEKLSIELPDSYIRKESKSCLIDAENKNNGNILLLKTLDVKNFDAGKVRKSMDTLCYNLSNAKLIKTEKEKFYQMDRDFVKRYYDAGKYKILTYTFYTRSYPYCILFTYNNESELNEINEIIDSIEIKMNVFGKFFYLFNSSLFMLIALGVVGFLFVWYFEEKGVSTISGFIILYILYFILGFILFETYGLLFKMIFPLFFFILVLVMALTSDG